VGTEGEVERLGMGFVYAVDVFWVVFFEAECVKEFAGVEPLLGLVC
jgi:hypothetical protein